MGLKGGFQSCLTAGNKNCLDSSNVSMLAGKVKSSVAIWANSKQDWFISIEKLKGYVEIPSFESICNKFFSLSSINGGFFVLPTV